MTILAETIEDIITHQRQLAAAMHLNDAAIERLEGQVKKLTRAQLHAVNPGVEFVVSFTGGSHTPDWQPQIYISGVRPSKTSRAMFVRVGDQWVYYADGFSDTKLYRHKVLTDAPAFDSAALEKAAADLSTELGIPVVFTEHSFIEPEMIEQPKTIDDLLLLHPDGEVLVEGKFWHVGWDIADPWAVLKTPGGTHVYYSTNGHGFGYDTHIAPGGDIMVFVNLFLTSNDTPPDAVKALLS